MLNYVAYSHHFYSTPRLIKTLETTQIAHKVEKILIDGSRQGGVTHD